MSSLLLRQTLYSTFRQRCATVTNQAEATNSRHFSNNIRTHLIFGANTDVGKTIISAGLVRSALHNGNAVSTKSNHNDDNTSSSSPSDRATMVNYIKPLQCGGSDESFVSNVIAPLLHKHSSTTTNGGRYHYRSKTLFSWDTPASPHYASRVERTPISNDDILDSLSKTLDDLNNNSNDNDNDSDCSDVVNNMYTYVESAGGVLSPASASPLNNLPHHANDSNDDDDHSSNNDAQKWGWSTQADLYQTFQFDNSDNNKDILPVILVGDGRLGGISSTLSALESLLIRGYRVDALIVIRDEDSTAGSNNVDAIKEYVSRPISLLHSATDTTTLTQSSCVLSAESIFSLPPLPPEPYPLDEWYQSTCPMFQSIHSYLNGTRNDHHRG